jgi:hypothetical protein
MYAGVTWTGVAFEVVGLGLVAVELTRVQRRDLGTPQWLQRVGGWWRRITRQGGRTGAVVTPHHTSAKVSAHWPPLQSGGVTLEHRVKELEANVDLLRDQGDHRYSELKQRLEEQGKRVDGLGADLDRQHAEREDERREQLRESVTPPVVGHRPVRDRRDPRRRGQRQLLTITGSAHRRLTRCSS